MKQRTGRKRDDVLDGARFRVGHPGLLGHRSAWIETPFSNDWLAAHRLIRQPDGTIVVGEIRIYPSHDARLFHAGTWRAAERAGIAAEVPAGGLSALIVRRAPIGHHLAVLGDYLQWLRSEGTRLQVSLVEELGFTVSAEPVSSGSTPAPDGGRRGRPKKYRDLYLAQLASAYIKASGQNDPDTGKPRRNPIATLATKKGWARNKVRMQVALARKRGLLTGEGGLAGGALTAKALALLNKGRVSDSR